MNNELFYQPDKINGSASSATPRLSHSKRMPRFVFSSGTHQQGKIVLVAVLLLLSISAGCALLPSPFLAAGICLLLGIGIAAFYRPQIALLSLIVCAGLPALVVSFPGHHMHLVEPAVALVLLIAIIRRTHMHMGRPHLLALFFLAIALVSFVHVPEFSTASTIYAADKRLLELLLIFLAFFGGTWLATAVKNGTGFLVALLLASLPLYLVGLMQALGYRLPAFLESAGIHDAKLALGRLWGPFPWPVNFAMYLVNLLAVALVCWLQGQRRWQRSVGCAMTLVTLLEIVGTGTRSTVLAALVIVFVACLMTRRYKVFCITLLLVGCACVPMWNKILLLFTHDTASTSNRLLIWQEAIRLIMANPWLGIGLQQFHYYYAHLIVGQVATLGAEGIHPHEQYIEWALESGIAWAIVGVLLLLSILIVCWRGYRVAPPGQKSILLAALLAMLANILIGFVDVPMDQLEGGVLLFLLAGLALGYAGQLQRKVPVKNIWQQAISYLQLRLSGIEKRAGNTARASSTGPYIHPPGNAATMVADRPDIQKTGRSIMLQLLSWGIALPLIFPMTALLTHYLGPTQYGEYSLTFPFLSIFALLSGTGMDPLIVRQLSCQPRTSWHTILSYAAGSRAIASILSAIVAASIACLLPISAELRNLFLLGSLSLLFSFSFNGLRIIYSHGFRAEQRVGLLALLEMLNRIITAGLIGLIVWLHLSLLWAYLLLVYSDLPMFLIQALVASRRFGIRLHFSVAHLRAYWLAGLRLVDHNTLTLLAGQINLCVLLLMAGPEAVGIYALAARAIDPLLNIVIAYVNGLFPLLCTTFTTERAQFAQVYHKALRILALAIVPLAIVVSMEANVIVYWLGGTRFAAASGAVRFLMWAMVLAFFNRVNERACMAAAMERELSHVTIASACVNLLLNLLLLPHWQIIGTSFAVFAGECLCCCLFFRLLNRHTDMGRTARTLLLICLSNLPMLLLLAWQRNMPLPLSLTLALLLTGAGYLLTGQISPYALLPAMHMLSRRRNKTLPIGDKATKEEFLAAENRESADYITLTLPRTRA